MKLGYDNLEDAKTKLVGTYCLFNGKAIVIKQIYPAVPGVDADYRFQGSFMVSGKGCEGSIDDPTFNCSEYSLGYVNRMNSAGWWYRIPMKQWKQGLRYDQVQMKASSRNYYGGDFKAGKAIAATLENHFPTFQQSVKLLKDQEAHIIAFHRNFAMTHDHIHDDFIFEYKGDKIGYSSNCEDFKLMREHEHLYEALKEAAN